MKFRSPALQVFLTTTCLEWSIGGRSDHSHSHVAAKDVSKDPGNPKRQLRQHRNGGFVEQLKAHGSQRRKLEVPDEMNAVDRHDRHRGGGSLVNPPSLAEATTSVTVECNPNLGNVGKADVGVLGCGEGAYCRSDPASDLGGFCETPSSHFIKRQRMQDFQSLDHTARCDSFTFDYSTRSYQGKGCCNEECKRMVCDDLGSYKNCCEPNGWNEQCAYIASTYCGKLTDICTSGAEATYEHAPLACTALQGHVKPTTTAYLAAEVSCPWDECREKVCRFKTEEQPSNANAAHVDLDCECGENGWSYDCTVLAEYLCYGFDLKQDSVANTIQSIEEEEAAYAYFEQIEAEFDASPDIKSQSVRVAQEVGTGEDSNSGFVPDVAPEVTSGITADIISDLSAESDSFLNQGTINASERIPKFLPDFSDMANATDFKGFFPEMGAFEMTSNLTLSDCAADLSTFSCRNPEKVRVCLKRPRTSKSKSRSKSKSKSSSKSKSKSSSRRLRSLLASEDEDMHSRYGDLASNSGGEKVKSKFSKRERGHSRRDHTVKARRKKEGNDHDSYSLFEQEEITERRRLSKSSSKKSSKKGRFNTVCVNPTRTVRNNILFACGACP